MPYSCEVIVAACLPSLWLPTSEAMKTGGWPIKFLAGPENGRDLSDPSQLWVRRDLPSIDWEPPCYELHKPVDVNMQIAWDSFMQDIDMKEELTEAEYVEFKGRFEKHVVSQVESISAHSLRENCALWAEIVKMDLDEDKPMITEALVRAFNKGEHSFTIAVTPDNQHLSHSDMRWRTGALSIDTHVTAGKAVRAPSALSRRDLPTDFDSRKQWPRCADVISRPHEQGHCGSCWAFGSAHALDSRLCIATEGAFQRQLSRTDLTSCTYAPPRDGCQGGWDMDVMQHVATKGVPTGGPDGCTPYFATGEGAQHFQNLGTAPECPAFCHNQDYHRARHEDTFVIPEVASYQMLWISSGFKLWHPEAPPDWISQIKQTLMEQGPLPVGVRAGDALFQAYAGGVYDFECDPHYSDHIASAVGWGSTPQQHFIIANSWGSWWGIDSGKMKLIPEALCHALLLPKINGSGYGIRVDGLDPPTPAPPTTSPTNAPTPNPGPVPTPSPTSAPTLVSGEFGQCFISDCGCPSDAEMTDFPGKTVEWPCSHANAPFKSEYCDETQGNCEASCNGVWCPAQGTTEPPTEAPTAATTEAPAPTPSPTSAPTPASGEFGQCFISDCGCPIDAEMTDFPDKTVEWPCSHTNAPFKSEYCDETQGNCEGSCSGVWCPAPGGPAAPSQPATKSQTPMPPPSLLRGAGR